MNRLSRSLQTFTQEMTDFIINNYTKKEYLKIDSGWLMRDNDIIFESIINTAAEQWTFNELNDIMCAFSIYANNYCGINNSIDGCLEIEYDKYL